MEKRCYVIILMTQLHAFSSRYLTLYFVYVCSFPLSVHHGVVGEKCKFFGKRKRFGTRADLLSFLCAVSVGLGPEHRFQVGTSNKFPVPGMQIYYYFLFSFIYRFLNTTNLQGCAWPSSRAITT